MLRAFLNRRAYAFLAASLILTSTKPAGAESPPEIPVHLAGHRWAGAISRDGTTIAGHDPVDADTFRFHVWDGRSGKERSCWTTRYAHHTYVLSHDGSLLASTSRYQNPKERNLILWDTATGKERRLSRLTEETSQTWPSRLMEKRWHPSARTT